MPATLPPLLLPALLALTLTACSTPTARQDVTSPYYKVPEDSLLELHQPVKIPPGTTRTWIQRGRAVSGFDRYWPSCNLEVGRLDRDQAQVIEPDRFVVRRSQFLREEVAGRMRPLRVASLRVAGMDDDGGHSMIFEGWHLWLESAEQPDVRRLTCRGAFADPWRAEPPSIEQIRAALGAVATLRLP